MKDETWSGKITSFLIAFVTLGFQSIEAKTLYTACPIRTCFKRGVAYFQGYFKDDVLDVEMLQMNANVSVAALAARNIDYNLILQSVVTANLRGLPLKVAGILNERPNYAVVVHPIKKFADLKGKKIAISSFAPWSIFSPA